MRRLGRDVVIYGGSDLAFKLVSFLIIPVYTHLLSVATFGTMTLLTVSAALLGSVANMGINNAAQRFYFDQALTDEQRASVVSTGLAQLVGVLIIAIPLGLVSLGAARELLARDYGLTWTWVVLVLVNVAPDQIAQYTLDTVRLHFSPWRFFFISLTKNVAGVVLGYLLLTRTDLGLTGIFLGTLIASSTASLTGLVLVRSDLTLRLNRGIWKAMFQFGYPFVFASAAYWVFGSMDRWLLLKLSDAEQVGLFSIGLKFAALLTFVITAFGQAWSPFALRMMREEPGYRATYARVLTMWFFLLGWIGLGVALFSPEIMIVLTPPAYWPAAPVLAIGTAGLVLFGTTQVTALGISLAKRTGLLTAGAWTAALANVGLNAVAIPTFGATGAAAATLVSYAVLTGWYIWHGQRLHPIPVDWPRLSCGASLVVAAALSPLILPLEAPSPATVATKLVVLAGALGLGLLSGVFDRAALRPVVARLRFGRRIAPADPVVNPETI